MPLSGERTKGAPHDVRKPPRVHQPMERSIHECEAPRRAAMALEERADGPYNVVRKAGWEGDSRRASAPAPIGNWSRVCARLVHV